MIFVAGRALPVGIACLARKVFAAWATIDGSANLEARREILSPPIVRGWKWLEILTEANAAERAILTFFFGRRARQAKRVRFAHALDRRIRAAVSRDGVQGAPCAALSSGAIRVVTLVTLDARPGAHLVLIVPRLAAAAFVGEDVEMTSCGTKRTPKSAPIVESIATAVITVFRHFVRDATRQRLEQHGKFFLVHHSAAVEVHVANLDEHVSILHALKIVYDKRGLAGRAIAVLVKHDVPRAARKTGVFHLLHHLQPPVSAVKRRHGIRLRHAESHEPDGVVHESSNVIHVARPEVLFDFGVQHVRFKVIHDFAARFEGVVVLVDKRFPRLGVGVAHGVDSNHSGEKTSHVIRLRGVSPRRLGDNIRGDPHHARPGHPLLLRFHHEVVQIVREREAEHHLRWLESDAIDSINNGGRVANIERGI
mmetsp:Transcript_23795/g.77367  ORF Transcript_23795/g.77367 Transcript_23795/m.77367 type:complete len:424 (-) Transcript_23795:410-1681(-)